MVQYGGRPIDPSIANAIKKQRSVVPQLSFGRLPGTFLSKNSEGVHVTVTRASAIGITALLFKTPLNEDLDGAPESYAPPTDFNNLTPMFGLHPLERSIKNATDKKDPDPVFHQNPAQNQFTWTGVVSRATPGPGQQIDNRPFLRDKFGRFPVFRPGSHFYAPQTAMVAADGQAVNPLTVPYVVLSTSMRNHGHVGLGDFGLAIRRSTGASIGFLYGDAGGILSVQVGECSRFLIRSLFGGPATSEDVSFVVFPGSFASSDIARPELIAPGLRKAFKDLSMFSNVDEVIARLATPHFGELLPGSFGNLQKALDDATTRSVKAALHRAGLP